MELTGLDSLPQGYSVVDREGMRLSVIKHGNRIDHIGRQLFPAVMREQDPLPAYDYLEFAFLEQSVLGNDNIFKYKDVFFAEGRWSNLESISEFTPCSISISDGRNYEVKWEGEGIRPVCIRFPVSYEIISTATRAELETWFLSDLRKYHGKAASVSVSSAELKASDNGLLLLSGEKYLLPTINSNTYFKKNGNVYDLVCDTNLPVETVANAVCSPFADWKNWVLECSFRLHNDREDAVIVALSDFASFCRSQQCLMYWGVEENTEEKITGTVIAYNPTAGYNHVLKLEYPLRQQGKERHIKANVSLFVPVTNIRDLHKQYNPNKQKIKWQ